MALVRTVSSLTREVRSILYLKDPGIQFMLLKVKLSK